MNYMAFWSKEAFAKEMVELVDDSFFSEDRGYTKNDQKQIGALSVGETWSSPDYGDYHLVTRVK